MKKIEQSSTSVQLLTGLTLMVSLSEGAQAGIMTPETQAFSLSGSDPSPTGNDASGDATFSDNSELSFALFDTLGGTQELTKVTFDWVSRDEGAFVLGSARLSSNEFAAAIDVSVSAGFTLDMFSGASTFFSSNLSNTRKCELGSGDATSCQAGDGAFFEGMIMPTDLSLFQADGGGLFDIGVNLLGGEASYKATGDGQEASWNSAFGSWHGRFSVTYDYREVSEVPAPATWLLFGLGLAGLGAVRSKRLNTDK
jgi:PEP-CTERM motif